MADTASINIEYEPNWENLHTRKRLEKVLAWAPQFCVGNRGTVLPVRLSSKILNEVFGPKGNQMGDYFRSKLLVEVSKSYSTKHKYCKEYHVKLAGFNELSERLFNNYTQTADVDTSRAIDRLKENHKDELASGKFVMKDASSRLWHPLQNLRRADKAVFWQNYLPHNYDISACAPSILYQLALKSGMPEILAEAIRLYVDTKGEFRQHVADISGLSVDDAKKLINSLFNGARLAKNTRCTAFQMLDFDTARMDALQKDERIQALRKAIRNAWKTIEMAMNSHAPKGAKVSLKTSKVKWGIYFSMERKVLNAITRELDNQDLHYFTEHDGFRTNKVPNIPAIEQAIFTATKLRLTILGD